MSFRNSLMASLKMVIKRYQGRLMALNIFSVNRISASSVARHFPSSSALRSTFEDLPTLAPKVLYCTSNLPSSSFLSLSSCSRFANSDYNRFF